MVKRLYLIPLCLSIFVVFGPFILLLIAEYNSHIAVTVPLISDTGLRAPESGIFTYFFNIGAFLVMLTVSIRHLLFVSKMQNLTKEHSDDNKTTEINKTNLTKTLNNFSLISGFLTAFGLTIIANIRLSEMFLTHNFGAILTSCFGSIDILLHSKLALDMGYTRLALTRLIIVMIIIPSFTSCAIANLVNLIFIKDAMLVTICSVCEWIGFCMFGPFYATFVPEFSQIKSISIFVDINDTSDENRNK